MRIFTVIMLLMLATLAQAETNYICVITIGTLTTADKTIDEDGVKTAFKDMKTQPLESRVKWQVKDHPELPASVVCYPVKVHGLNTKITVEQVQKETLDKMTEKTKILVLGCGMSPADDLTKAGFEPVKPKAEETTK